VGIDLKINKKTSPKPPIPNRKVPHISPHPQTTLNRLFGRVQLEEGAIMAPRPLG